MRKWLVSSIAVLCLLAAARANAQEKGQVGITMGYPASIGLTWHAARVIAIRPSFSVSHSSFALSDMTATSTNDIDTTEWRAGLGALFYIQKWDKASTYLSPRFAYAREKGGQRVLAGGTVSSFEPIRNTYYVTGSLGAQYSLGRRLAVFGEAGLEYSHLSVSHPWIAGTYKDWSTRGALGIVVYLN